MVNQHKYTPKQIEFIRDYASGHSSYEIAEAFNDKFKTDLSRGQIKGFMSRFKICSGLDCRFKKGSVPYNKGKHTPTVGRMADTQYKLGHMPHNYRPVGSERITKAGYIEVKVRERPDRNPFRNNWELKHRIVWEKVHGKIPPGHKVCFLDGNKQNVNIDNLVLLTFNEECRMNHRNLFSDNPELTKVGVSIAKAKIACADVKRRLKGDN